MEPASIRYKNPGAMWGNALAKKWGALSAVKLNDGLGQGNNIAVFPTYIQGICAQLDLWRTSANYKNKRFADAIRIWSGGNYVESYINFVLSRVPGMARDTVMDDSFWRGSMAIPFLKAQAWHEAGKQYPAPDEDWIEAQKRVFSGMPTTNTVKKAAMSVAAGTVSGAAGATQAGFGVGTALCIGAAVALVMFLVWKFKPSKPEQETPHPAIVADPPIEPAEQPK